MQETGTVRKLEGDKAIVVIKRQSACGENCASCGGCKDKFNEITADNKIGACPGDTVIVEMSDSTVLYAAFKVYIIPLIIFFLGYGITWQFFKYEFLAVITGILSACVFYIFLHIKDKKDKEKYIHKIIEIEERK